MKPLYLFSLLAVCLLLSFLSSLAFGSTSLADERFRDSILHLRLQRTVVAACAGAALAVAGVLTQALFRNPLADPFVLGINSGASLGVAIIVMAVGGAGLGLSSGFSLGGNVGIVLASGLGGAVVMLLVLQLAKKVDMMTLLIIGLMLSYITSAIVSILMHLSLPEQLQSYMSWTFGDFGSVEWTELVIFAPALLVGILMSLFCSKPLNALLLGEHYAKSLGVNTRSLKLMLILSSSLLAGAVTAYCGPIGFIGVAVPHLCRGLIKKSDHRILLPCCIVVGASVSLTADLLSQIPGSAMTLPLNAVTALIGAPIILFVLLKRSPLRQNFAS